MSISRVVIASALLAASLGAAHAEGLYGGVSLGSPNWHADVNGVQSNDHGVSGKLYLGYALNPNLSIEGGYAGLGRIEDPLGLARGHAVFVDAVGTWPIAPQWSVLGRAGLAHGDVNTSYGDDTSFGLRAGVGLQYELTPTVAIRTEYERNHFNNLFDNSLNVDQLTVGLKMKF